MDQFIEYAVNRFIDDAEKEGCKKQMLKAFREESEDQLTSRIMSVMEELELNFTFLSNSSLVVCDRVENARIIVEELKKKLAPELAQVV